MAFKIGLYRNPLHRTILSGIKNGSLGGRYHEHSPELTVGLIGKGYPSEKIRATLEKRMYPILETMGGIPKDTPRNVDYQWAKAHYITDAEHMINADLDFTIEKVPYDSKDSWYGSVRYKTNEPFYGIIIVPVSGKGTDIEKAQMKRLYISIAVALKNHNLQIVDKAGLHGLIEGFILKQAIGTDSGSVHINEKNGVRELSYLRNYRYWTNDQEGSLYQCISVKGNDESSAIGIRISPKMDGGYKNSYIIDPISYQEPDFFPATSPA